MLLWFYPAFSIWYLFSANQCFCWSPLVRLNYSLIFLTSTCAIVTALAALKRIESSCFLLFEDLNVLRDDIVDIIGKIRSFIEFEEAENYKARYRNQANFIGGLKNEVRLLQKKFEECSDTTSRLLSKQGKFIERMSLVIDAIGDSEEVIYFIIFSFTLYSTLIILYCCRFLSRSRYGGCPSKSLIWRQILTMVKWMMIWQMEWLEWRNLYVKVKWQIEILL